jgi:hypothetical protein
MKATSLKMMCIAAAAALFLSVNVQAQSKMAKDTSKKMAKMGHKKMGTRKMNKMKKDSSKM